MSLEIKVIAALCLLLMIAGGLGEFGHIRYRAGDTDGAARIQMQWDADREAIQVQAAKAISEANWERDQAQSANEGIHNDYQTQLLSARALSSDLAQRLRDAQNRLSASSGAVPKAGGGQGSATAPLDSSVGRLDGLLGETLNECYANRLRQSALIKEITPQL